MDAIVKTDNLSKKYNDKYALNNCSLTVNRGDIYGIIGKNGAGKSTLMKILCGITEKTQGDYELFGGKNLSEGRKKIGAILENPTLFGNLTARDNLRYFAIQKGITNEDTIKKALELVGLNYDDGKVVKNYSVGMKQRLAISVCLLGEPELLILDEPINGIDPKGIVEIRDLLKSLNKENGVTIIISSHVLPELENLVNKIAIINDGQVIDKLSLDDLHSRDFNYIEIYTSDINRTVEILKEQEISKIDIQNGRIRVKENIEDSSEVVSLLVNNGIKVYEIFRKEETLEEFYLRNIS